MIGPHTFTNWGSHHDSYPTAYFTVAAAIGMRREEVDIFLERLDKVFVKFRKKHAQLLPAIHAPDLQHSDEECNDKTD